MQAQALENSAALGQAAVTGENFSEFQEMHQTAGFIRQANPPAGDLSWERDTSSGLDPLSILKKSQKFRRQLQSTLESKGRDHPATAMLNDYRPGSKASRFGAQSSGSRHQHSNS